MLVNNKTIDNGFLPPDQLFIDELPGLRAIAFERLARDLYTLFGNKHEEITNKIKQVYKIDKLTASMMAFRYYEQVRSIYANAAEQISAPIRKEMYEAIECEKSGDVNRAIQLFESVIGNGFPPSTPYERLRIIYRKQGLYQEAIRVCERYIEILELIKAFWPDYSNLKLIDRYVEHIVKLEHKLK